MSATAIINSCLSSMNLSENQFPNPRRLTEGGGNLAWGEIWVLVGPSEGARGGLTY